VPKILNERFVFISDTPVAAGATADVYKTFDLMKTREAAVKLFKVDFASDRILKEAYDREIKCLFDLNIDEHIVDLLDTGIDGETERRYIALEWVESNLKDFTKTHPVTT
jgi:serine/threonine protein kinase